MSRLQPVEKAEGRTQELLDAVQQKYGRVPNIMRLMANSPVVLEGYLDFNSKLANGKLAPQLRERIAIAVASANGCNYCLSAHTAAGQMYGLSTEELTAAQRGESSGAKEAAALRFATKLVRERGWVTDEDVTTLRQAGFGDGEITEIIALVALNTLTNYFNHVAEPEIDFPLVKAVGK